MIDLTHETLVPLAKVPELLPRRPSGKRLHISAVYRWAQRGVRGVSLETIKIGGTTYTSREALQRFAEGRANIQNSSPQAAKQPTQRRRERDRATRRVNDILNNRRQ